MPLILDNHTLHYYENLNIYNTDRMLTVATGKNSIDKINDYLYLPLFLPVEEKWKNILKYGQDYNVIYINDNVFLSSNPYRLLSVPMYKFPNGNTCLQIIDRVIPKKNDLTYFVSQDDGTKVNLPPIYYALRFSKRLDTVLKGHATFYALNYLSCSDSAFSRSKIRVNILNTHIKPVNWVITPAFKSSEDNKLLEKWCKEHSLNGYIIYGPDVFENTNYFYRLTKTLGFSVINGLTTKKYKQIQMRKYATKELLPCLINQGE